VLRSFADFIGRMLQKWKAFAAQVEAVAKGTKKKDTKATLNAYAQARSALEEYLEEVELQL
jgi:spore germination cell wall hydrolase CwlJ-like protein